MTEALDPGTPTSTVDDGSRPFWSPKTALRLVLGILAVVGVNIVLVLVAVPIGLAIGQLFWSVVAAEAVLLAACLVGAATVAVRGRRGLGPGLVLGWAVGYLGLIGAVVALIIAAVVVVALAWLALLVLSVVSAYAPFVP